MIDLPVRPAPWPRPPPQSEADAFDRWLRDDLARRFGRTVGEPIPDDILELLEPKKSS